MSKTSVYWILGFAGSLALTMMLWTWNGSAEQQSERPPLVYIDRESNEIFFANDQVAQLVHPETGKATLTGAVFCPQCETWSPSPPLERLVRDKHAINCPVCKTQRSFEGAIPDDARELH